MCSCPSEVRKMNTREKSKNCWKHWNTAQSPQHRWRKSDCTAVFYKNLSRMESFTVLDVVYMYKVVHGEYFLPLAAQVWAQYLLARYRPLSTSLFRSYLRSKEILGNLAVKRVVHNSGIDVCNLLIKPARTKLLV